MWLYWNNTIKKVPLIRGTFFITGCDAALLKKETNRCVIRYTSATVEIGVQECVSEFTGRVERLNQLFESG
jgi:hypothetical protein